MTDWINVNGMNTNWTPLWSDMLTSSLWSLGKPGLPEEERRRGKNAKLLFLTMIPLANQEGFISASLGGLADLARLTNQETVEALPLLEGPDEDSRNKANDGRRVKRVDGGWVILNYGDHWQRMAEERRKAQLRKAAMKYRQNQKDLKPSKPLPGEVVNGKLEKSGASQKEINQHQDNTLPNEQEN